MYKILNRDNLGKCNSALFVQSYEMAAVGVIFILLPMTWACAPQKAGKCIIFLTSPLIVDQKAVYLLLA